MENLYALVQCTNATWCVESRIAEWWPNGSSIMKLSLSVRSIYVANIILVKKNLVIHHGFQ